MRGRTKHSGLMLLEILVAIGLLVFGMVVIGAQMSHAVDRTYETADMAKVHIFSRIDPVRSGDGIDQSGAGDRGGFQRVFSGVCVSAICVAHDSGISRWF